MQLADRSPPSVDQLRATKAGLLVRRLRAHSHSTIVALASALLELWKAAAAAEERRTKRTAALGGGSHGAAADEASKLHADGTSASVAGGGASAQHGASTPALHTDPTRQTGQLLLAEALRAGGVEGVSGAATDLILASHLEAAVFALAKAATGKAFKSSFLTIEAIRPHASAHHGAPSHSPQVRHTSQGYERSWRRCGLRGRVPCASGCGRET